MNVEVHNNGNVPYVRRECEAVHLHACKDGKQQARTSVHFFYVSHMRYAMNSKFTTARMPITLNDKLATLPSTDQLNYCRL